LNFEGKKAIVTGGASGIGKCTALKLAKWGADVAIVDLNTEGAHEVLTTIKEFGCDGMFLKTDITKFDEVLEMAKNVYTRFGKIDILINNAAWDKIEFFMNTGPELWQKLIDVNLIGHINCTKAVLHYMVEHRSGAIVNVASDAARVGSTGEAVYSAAKGGVVSFTKSIAREMAKYNIRVNCICPGPTETPLFEEVKKDAPHLVEAIIKSVPFKRLAKPCEIANGIAFFASDLSTFITGQVLSVNGGLNMV